MEGCKEKIPEGTLSLAGLLLIGALRELTIHNFLSETEKHELKVHRRPTFSYSYPLLLMDALDMLVLFANSSRCK